MNKFYYDDGMFYVNNYEFSLDSLVELLDMISDLEDTEIVDVDIDPDGYSVTCTFADGEKQTAHCHPEDYDNWSLETGISVCLGKYLTGGSSEYNRIVRHGVKVFNDKLREEVKEIKDRIEEERIRENKRRKRERYLKRRDERRRAAEECSQCDEREFCENRKDKKPEEKKAEEKMAEEKRTEDKFGLLSLINKIIEDIGLEIEIVEV